MTRTTTPGQSQGLKDTKGSDTGLSRSRQEPSTTISASASQNSAVASVSGLSDAELLKRVQNADPEAASELYGRYASRLRALAHSRTPIELKPMVESVDIVQSVMGSFFRRASKGDYELPDGLELWSLLLVITLNKIKDAGAFHRSQKRDARRTTRVGPGEWDQLALCDPQSNSAQLRLLIDEVLGALDESRKQMVELRIAGFSVDEIADQTKRAKRSVERVLQDVRARFLKALADPD